MCGQYSNPWLTSRIGEVISSERLLLGAEVRDCLGPVDGRRRPRSDGASERILDTHGAGFESGRCGARPPDAGGVRVDLGRLGGRGARRDWAP